MSCNMLARRRPEISLIVLLVVLLQLTTGKVILHDPVGGDRDLLGPICPRYRDFGIQNITQLNTSDVKIFAVSASDMGWLCEDVLNATQAAKLRDIFRGNILILPREVETELVVESSSNRFAYLKHICVLEAFFVITQVPQYLANARPADLFESVRDLSSNCAVFGAQRKLDAQDLRSIGLANNLTASLSIDKNDYLALFAWVYFIIMYKGVLSAGYLGTALYSLYLLLLRMRRGTLSAIFSVVLFLNFATMGFLGVLQAYGPHFTDNKLPQEVASFGLSIFFGTSVGTGILIVILYDDLISNMFSSQRNVLQRKRTWLFWASALLMIVMDFYLALVSVFSRSRNQTIFVRILVSLSFLGAQLAVILAIYMKAKVVMKILARLSGFRSRLERHFRFWLLIMVLSAVLTIFGILIVPGLGNLSPVLYADCSIALAVGKIMYVFSQSKLCAPVQERGMVKGKTAAVSSVGYETFTQPVKHKTMLTT